MCLSADDRFQSEHTADVDSESVLVLFVKGTFVHGAS